MVVGCSAVCGCGFDWLCCGGCFAGVLIVLIGWFFTVWFALFSSCV